MILNFKATKLASIFLLLAFNTFTNVHGQDVHFSQFDGASLSVNPALIASGEQSLRYSIQVRDQWREGLGTPYSTKRISLEQKIRPCNTLSKHKLSYGLSLINDKAGDSNIDLYSVSGALAYTYQYVEEISFTIGLMGGYNNRSFNISNLTWPEYWNELGFRDPAAQTTEEFSNFVLGYESVSVGFNFYGKQSKLFNDDGTISRQGRSNLNFGVGVFNLTQPELNFYNREGNSNDPVKLPIRTSVYMVPIIEVDQQLDLKFKALAQFQNTYFESLLSGGLIYHFDNKEKPLSLGLAVGARIWSLDNDPSLTGEKKKLVDSIIPEFTASFRNWDFGFTYDITVSNFKEPTNRRGGPEFFLRKNIFNCLQVPPYRPNCRIF